MDDEPERRGCGYMLYKLSSHFNEGRIIGIVAVALLFFVSVICVRPVTLDYYIFNTWIDNLAFGCLATIAIMAAVGAVVFLKLRSGALIGKLLGLFFLLLSLAWLMLMVAALINGLHE